MHNDYYSKDQDIHFKIPTPEEERELFVKARAGDGEAKTFIITNHLLFASMEAAKRARGALPRDEVTSAANYAVMKAYEGFDHTKGFRFSTYLRPFISGEVSQLWKTKFSAPGISDPSVGGGQYGSAPAADPANIENRKAVSGHVLHEDHEAEELDLTRFEMGRLMKALAKMPPHWTELLKMHYFEEKSFAEIARLRGVTREAVRVAHERLLIRLKRSLKARA